MIEKLLEIGRRLIGVEAKAAAVQQYSLPSFDDLYAYSSSLGLDILPNTDEVLEEFAPNELLAHYAKILRLSGYLYGILGLRIDAAFALPHAWVSGDAEDDEANEIRDNVEDAWNNLQDRDAAVRKLMVYGIGCGIAFGEYARFGIHRVQRSDRDVSLVVPMSLIDRPSDRFAFNRRGEVVFTPQNALDVRVVNPLQIVVARFGSADWYGEAQLKFVYSDFWEMHTIRKMALEALEKQGYPLQIVEVPSSVDDVWLRQFRATVRAQYPNSVVYRGQAERLEWKEPARDSSPTFVGGDQIERMRQLQDSISVGLLGVALSNNSGVGSYAKDKVAAVQMFDKTPADVGLHDSIANDYRDKVCALNYPDVPRYKWPRMVSDAAPQEDLNSWTTNLATVVGLGMQVDAAAVAEKLSIPLAGTDDQEVMVLRKTQAPNPFVRPPESEQPPPEQPQADDSMAVVMSEAGVLYEMAEFNEAEQTIRLRAR